MRRSASPGDQSEDERSAAEEGPSNGTPGGEAQTEEADGDDLTTVLKRTALDVALAAADLLPSSEKRVFDDGGPTGSQDRE